jgi:glycosyltransferase involved in cell wall biosynthesis
MVTYFASQLALYRALSRASDIPKDAVVFVNTLLPVAAMVWGYRTGRRVVVHVHEISVTPGFLRRFLTFCAGRFSHLLLYVSKSHWEGLPIEGPPALIVPNPVAATLAAQASGHTARQDRKQFRILMLASLRDYKGINEFIALARDFRKRTDIGFDLVLNAEPSDVTSFARRNRHLANLKIHSRTDDPARFYTRADLVVNLSRVDEWIETFGLTLVEAMTFGIPVIAPPVGGPAEIITHGTEGYCIDSRDSAALHDAILKLADDSENYEAMARAARKQARNFSFDAYAKALHEALSTLDEK